MLNKSKGFTLIELLVVVAIIGILAGVVLGTLNNARGKAGDARVESQLSSMRNQAELYSGTGTAFTAATCATTAGTIFETANGGLGTILGGFTLSTTRCASTAGQPSTGSSWAVAAQTTTGAWCADSSGWSSERTKSGTPALYTTTLTSAIAVGGVTCL